MPYCEQCGGEVDPGDTFCTHCGTDLGGSEPPGEQGAGGSERRRSRASRSSERRRSSQPTRGGERSPQPRSDRRVEGGRGGSPSGRRGRRQRSQSARTEPRTRLSAYTLGQKLVVGGAALAVAGALLPWFTVDAFGTSASVNGIERDGIFTFISAFVVVALVLYQGPGRWRTGPLAGCVIAGLLVALLGTAYIYDPWLGTEQPTAAQRAYIDIGIGLYLTAFSGYVVLGGAAADIFRNRTG